MLFVKRILSSFRYSVFSKCSSSSTSKLSGFKSSKGQQNEEEENCRDQQTIAMTQFLLNECGLSEFQAIAIGRRKDRLFKTKSIRTAQQAVQIFKDSGFSQDEVRKIVFTQPHVLFLKVDTQLKPKIEFMKELGFNGSNLARIISRAPSLFCRNLEHNLSPKMSLLVGVFGSKLNLCKILMRYPRLLTSGSEEVLTLESEYLRNLGVLEGSKAFANALAVVDSSGLEIFKNKLKHMVTLGLQENEILQILRKFPRVFSSGIDKMTKNMNFLKNTVGFQPNIVVTYPCLLMYNLENRIRPRHMVIEFLRETDPSRLPQSLANLYHMSEQRFADRFIVGSLEATNLFQKYKGKFIDVEVGADRKGV